MLLIIIAVAGFFILKPKNKTAVQTAQIGKGTVREELVLTGSVSAVKYAALTFPASGKIGWVGVAEGAKVKKGTAITSLDKTTLNSAYQQALSNYRNYQAIADQALDSVKGHDKDETFAQKATRTTAEVNRDNAYDAVTAAKYNLVNSTIYAPFDGIVSSLPYTSPGVNVSFTDVQVVIVDPSTIYFDVDADQNDVTKLKIGQSVVVVLDSYQDKELNGKITFISYTPKAGVTGTNYKVKVEFDQAVADASSVRVGMTGDAKFTLSSKDNVLFVPADFVKSDTKGKYLKVGKENNKVYIETGLESEERIEILGDKVKEGETVFD